MKKISVYLATFVLIAITFNSPVFPLQLHKPPSYENLVRVAILNDADQLNLSIRGDYKITDFTQAAVLATGRNLFDAKVMPALNGMWVGKKNYSYDKVSVKVVRDASVYINNRPYRGEIDIIKKPNNKFLIINKIDVEDYIRGVLYHEISHRWPLEAIKAQAIAVRTYALYIAQESKGKDFDLTSDIYSQVYGGAGSEKKKTDRAVGMTRGLVLKYNGKIFPTYYHATCAGYTEDSTTLWKVDIAPLDGVACNFCIGSPHFVWKNQVKLADLEKKLRDAGYKVGGITNIFFEQINKSGRYMGVRIESDSAPVIISTKDFRNIIGPNVIRSTKFNATIIKDNVIFEGTGWGHGVGLCQWGSFGMASKGYTAKQILKYYYPGAEISKLSSNLQN